MPILSCKKNGILFITLIFIQLSQSNVVIFSYHYLLDPKVSNIISRELSSNSVVVFDEAHNIDNVCLEALSIDITRPMLESSKKSLDMLEERINM